jgi:hypothetical protein
MSAFSLGSDGVSFGTLPPVGMKSVGTLFGLSYFA